MENWPLLLGLLVLGGALALSGCLCLDVFDKRDRRAGIVLLILGFLLLAPLWLQPFS